jgi:hypothetical protein
VSARTPRERPDPWHLHSQSIRLQWLKLFHGFEWCLQWCAYYMGRWAFLEVLEYAGHFSVLVAVILYFNGAEDRRKMKHYQAWQVINTAQGKGGNGGRITALEELNADGIALVGVDADGAFLSGMRLPNANLARCQIEAADLRNVDFSGAMLEYGHLSGSNFRSANLGRAHLAHADLADSDLTDSNLAGADLADTDLSDADLTEANLKGAQWSRIADISKANIFGVKNAPPGFVDWAMAHGAVSTKMEE